MLSAWNSGTLHILSRWDSESFAIISTMLPWRHTVLGGVSPHRGLTFMLPPNSAHTALDNTELI